MLQVSHNMNKYKSCHSHNNRNNTGKVTTFKDFFLNYGRITKSITRTEAIENCLKNCSVKGGKTLIKWSRQNYLVNFLLNNN